MLPVAKTRLAVLLVCLVACRSEPKHDGRDSAPRIFLGDALPSTSEPPAAGGVLRVAMEAEPATLNYQLDPLDAWTKKIDDLLFDTLARPNGKTFVHEPRLAERWALSSDQRTLTFFLRRDVRWHDGVPFTANDVMFTFDVLRAETSKTLTVRANLSPLAKVERIDDFTVRFLLKEPYWAAFDAIAETMIYPAHLYARGDFNTHAQNRAPIGNGAYRFVRWTPGNEIVLTKNRDYYGQAGHFDELVFKVVPDATVRLLMLRRGELDVVERVTPEVWKKLETEPDIQARYLRLRHVPSGLQWIGWNTRHPALADKRIRRALTMLIDRRDIVEHLRYGLDRIAASWFYPGALEYNEALAPLPYDPSAATKLLEQAGVRDSDADGVREHGGMPLRLRFVYPASPPFYDQLAGLLTSDFLRAGIVVEPHKLEWAAFMARVQAHDFDACSMLWQLVPRSDPFQIWHSSSVAGQNYIEFKHDALDRLLEEARRELDDEKRTTLYKRLSEILADEQPYTLLFHRYNLSIVAKSVGGVTSTPYGLFRYEELFRRASK